MADKLSRDEAKYWFLRCVSCSEASVTMVNRAAGQEHTAHEQAAHFLSGGFMHQGHACGQLWGAALAAGIRAKERFADEEARSPAALHAAQRLVAAFANEDWSINCRENIGGPLTSLSGRLRYLRSERPRACGRTSIAWASKAHDVIEDALDDFDPQSSPGAKRNCAVECMQRIAPAAGLDESDSVLVAGFAGGLGLAGNVCGTLAAGVFALTARHYRDRGPERRDSKLRGALQELDLVHGLRRLPARLLSEFKRRFGSVLCRDIVERRFERAGDYTGFIAGGGCREVVDFVAEHTTGALA